ncbi:MAG TPA: gamma-glutamylcyclotransferase family protein [Mucilaginibacter sp.]|nr:gamma-glutamylcyclotransferase family protein [Mucilaginibacter sp.]
MNNLLFVYGSLLDEDNKYGLYLRANSKFFSAAKVRGKLYDIGEYPGAVLSPDDDEYVHGTIFRLNDPVSVLPIIDLYEGFGADQPKPNEFIRIQALAEAENGTPTCWVYIYNLPVNGLPVIGEGRYSRSPL